MQLTFDPADLRPEFQTGEGSSVDQAISTSQIAYEHLNDQAQQALRVVGKGTYFNWQRDNYNVVYPPK
jgi:hypothetical protein